MHKEWKAATGRGLELRAKEREICNWINKDEDEAARKAGRPMPCRAAHAKAAKTAALGSVHARKAADEEEREQRGCECGRRGMGRLLRMARMVDAACVGRRRSAECRWSRQPEAEGGWGREGAER